MYQYRPTKVRKKRKWVGPLVVLVVLSGYCVWALLRPLGNLQPTPAVKQFSVDTPPSKLVWPATGQAAVSLLDSPILETHGDQKPVPTASTAKVITALVVLDKKPLKPGQQGPVITLTDADVALFQHYAANDGSLVPVVAGEQISEYQMLQAIMLPSANNIADTMAIWAYGSLENYSKAANAYVKAHGLTNTTVGTDASGFSPTTVSTAEDLTKLGALAMKAPVLAEIVGQASATGIPQTTVLKNVNSLLGTSNIVGIKTGNTDQAGGVFMSASKIDIAGKPQTIITAVASSPNLYTALKDSLTLVRSAQNNFSPVTVIRQGDVVAHYRQPWAHDVAAVAAKTMTAYSWNGQPLSAKAILNPLPLAATQGAKAGTISASDGTAIQLNTSQATVTPSVVWRLSHPF